MAPTHIKLITKRSSKAFAEVHTAAAARGVLPRSMLISAHRTPRPVTAAPPPQINLDDGDGLDVVKSRLSAVVNIPTGDMKLRLCGRNQVRTRQPRASPLTRRATSGL